MAKKTRWQKPSPGISPDQFSISATTNEGTVLKPPIDRAVVARAISATAETRSPNESDAETDALKIDNMIGGGGFDAGFARKSLAQAKARQISTEKASRGTEAPKSRSQKSRKTKKSGWGGIPPSSRELAAADRQPTPPYGDPDQPPSNPTDSQGTKPLVYGPETTRTIQEFHASIPHSREVTDESATAFEEALSSASFPIIGHQASGISNS